MKCECGGKLGVLQTFKSTDNICYRKRQCKECKKNIYTFEDVLDEEMAHKIWEREYKRKKYNK